ncbi:hypothetical protein KFE25_003123 [Diacronema lutheri]|uniref:Aspartyl/asparaginy/proline hydroxylase domain-containing protein n=1 Tax=Diacronema lutheri TaxID=2081491 RepID=A0A8J5X339_DIALT|nr:hypothetical protein KFE25_003123 [Diacronema lutheri]
MLPFALGLAPRLPLLLCGDAPTPVLMPFASVDVWSRSLHGVNLRAAMSRLNAARRAHMCNARELHNDAAELFRAAGVEMNAAGVDFTIAILRGRLPVVDLPRFVNATAPLLELYIPGLHNVSSFAPRRVLFNDPQHVLVHARRFLAIDLPAMYPPRAAVDAIIGADLTARRLYDALQRDGALRVARFEGLDIAALRAAATPILNGLKQDPAASVWKVVPLEAQPIVHGWLSRNVSLRRALGAYATPALGKPLHMGALQLIYIFLHPVSSTTGRPTHVALGSHRLLHFSRLGYVDSRYDDAWVRKTYEVATMGGDTGGGLVLDVNALHRATLVGDARDAVVIDIVQQTTCERLAQNPQFVTKTSASRRC